MPEYKSESLFLKKCLSSISFKKNRNMTKDCILNANQVRNVKYLRKALKELNKQLKKKTSNALYKEWIFSQLLKITSQLNILEIQMKALDKNKIIVRRRRKDGF